MPLDVGGLLLPGRCLPGGNVLGVDVGEHHVAHGRSPAFGTGTAPLEPYDEPKASPLDKTTTALTPQPWASVSSAAGM